MARGTYAVRVSLMRFLVGLLCVVCLLIPTGSANAQAVLPGTYRIWICAESCALQDSARAVAEALVVVVSDSAAATTEVRAAFGRLPKLTGLGSAVPVNVCFRTIRRERNVGKEELFFGIVPIAATLLSELNGAFLLRMYASPDAFYNLTWSGPGRITSGEGWASGPFANNPWHRNSFFVASHVGPPDISRCTS